MNAPHPIKQVLTIYDDAYRATFDGVPAPINGAKDSKLAKELLERYTVEQLRGFLGTFFESEDAFIQQSGYTFGVFVACLGKVIVARQRSQSRQVKQQMFDEIRAKREERRVREA